MMKIDLRRFVSRFAGCAALVLIGCGQPGGETAGGETSAASTAETGPGSSSSSSSSSGSGAVTEGGGSGGQTEGGMSSTGAGTTAETSPGTTAETSPGTSSGGESSSSGGSSGGGDLCEGFEQPGCIHNGCPEGQKCNTEVGCVPSNCGCDPQTGAINCTADCGGGTCVKPVECEPVPCNLFCEFGFKLDEFGCEICQCNDGPPPDCGCVTDVDCVKATPGCCSCNMGGTEVAVAVACVDQLEQCPLPPDEVVCPAVYKCTDMKAVCSKGQCVLQ